jgi:transposase
MVAWARREFAGEEITFAVEDCRQMSTRLERALLTAGFRVVRVPPKLMAGARVSARTRGKSDTIDALAVARAVLREPGLPTARLDGSGREVRLLVDHRESLVRERTRVIGRLRWHLHELDPTWEPPVRGLDRASAYETVEARLTGSGGLVVRLARALVGRCRLLTAEINALGVDIAELVEALGRPCSRSWAAEP